MSGKVAVNSEVYGSSVTVTQSVGLTATLKFFAAPLFALDSELYNPTWAGQGEY